MMDNFIYSTCLVGMATILEYWSVKVYFEMSRGFRDY
jgi:hypothetical protein